MSEAYDVAVVGAGLAGMAAATYAGNRGLKTVQVGNAGALLFSSGLLDLMAVHPIAEGRSWEDPWAAAARVASDLPGHPYAKAKPEEIRAGFTELLQALEEVGLGYGPVGDTNYEVITGVGTIKRTFGVPRTMLAGVSALADRVPCLLVDFPGLREFSAHGIAESLSERWPGLRSVRVEFPGEGPAGEVYAAHLAKSLELGARRARLTELIRPHVRDARVVGLPAVLGVSRTGLVTEELSRALGVPVFEIPTMPTSVPGLRLKDALERAVAARGVTRVVHERVVAVTPEADGFVLHLDQRGVPLAPIKAGAVILATGRFMGGGLVADRTRIREALMGLPVVQPAARADWHSQELFDPRGHALNMAGVEVDDRFRPRAESGEAVHRQLFAVGTILAHQDWARMKCGAGVAVASAMVAVDTVHKARATGRGIPT